MLNFKIPSTRFDINEITPPIVLWDELNTWGCSNDKFIEGNILKEPGTIDDQHFNGFTAGIVVRPLTEDFKIFRSARDIDAIE